MDGNADELKFKRDVENYKENEQDSKVEQPGHVNSPIKVDQCESVNKGKDERVDDVESATVPKKSNEKNADPDILPKKEKVGPRKIRKVDISEPIAKSKGGKFNAGPNRRSTGQPKRPPRKKKTVGNKPNTSGLDKLKRKLGSLGETVKKYWNLWSKFITKNKEDPKPPTTEKTLGVPGYEEIACIEAEVPDIMMMDKDRVRTSCQDCMRDPPLFPSKEQIKAKLIAADKYYGVKSEKIKELSEAFLEHEADYYDADGSLVRPSWRFILERPLVEQYVLMTNYIRKVSVLSELKEEKTPKKFIEEEDSCDDTEYKRFEQKLIRERKELLKPILKPKTQDMAVQTTNEPKPVSSDKLKESVSEVSLYPESEESTNSPEVSAVTIVTSRDYTSPLQSDFDGRTTDKSTSNRGGNWWDSQGEPVSESYQRSFDSINKNTSGSDGQIVPVHSGWSQNENYTHETHTQITCVRRGVEPQTHKKPKESKKVSFSPVVTCYQGPNRNAALYNLPVYEDTEMKINQFEPQQQNPENGNTPLNETQRIPANDLVTEVTFKSNGEIQNFSKGKMVESIGLEEEAPISRQEERSKPSNKRELLGNLLQDKNREHIISMSMPPDWNEDRIIRNNKMLNVVKSRPKSAQKPIKKKISFQEFEVIPDLEISDTKVSSVQDTRDADVQTPVAQKMTAWTRDDQHREPAQSGHHNRFLQKSRQNKAQPISVSLAVQVRHSKTLVDQSKLETKMPNGKLHHAEGLMDAGSQRMETKNYTQISSPRSETLGNEQTFIGYEAIPVIHGSMKTKDITAQDSLVESKGATSIDPSRKDNNPRLQQQVGRAPANPTLRNADNVPVHNTNQNLIQIPRLLPDIPQIRSESSSQQQQSTDTDGPSSSSNEHIKLKASPACFFKVATPTDLSKISVDEFYPDVPEIDAELSEMSETTTQSAPQVEIVFTSKESALRYIQEAEFHRISRKEENMIPQKPMKTAENYGLDIANKITTTAGVNIRIEKEDIEQSNRAKSKSSNVFAGKGPMKDSSQQSSITRNVQDLGSTSRPAPREFEGKSHVPDREQTLSMMSTGRTAMHLHDNACESTKLEEVKPSNPQVVKDTSLPFSDPVQNERNKETRSFVAAPAESASTEQHNDQTVGSFEKGENTFKEPSERTIIHEQSRATGKVQTEKVEDLTYEEGEEQVAIEGQTESLPPEPGEQLIYPRTKLYTRTLSSLTEETSSIAESTGSAVQEKVIDMPVTEMSVEELKTIFEKKLEVGSASGESEVKLEESLSDCKKRVGPLNEKLDNCRVFGKVATDETVTAANVNTNAISRHEQNKSEGIKPINSQEERSKPYGNTSPHLVGANLESSKDKKISCPNAEGNNSVVGPDRERNTAAVIQEETSLQQLSQIDVIRASEIYSNTSIYFSSEDRITKLSKARVGFKPVTLEDDLTSNASLGIACETEQKSITLKKVDPGSTNHLPMKETQPGIANNSKDDDSTKSKEQSIAAKTDCEPGTVSGDQRIQQATIQPKQTLGEDKTENEELAKNTKPPSNISSLAAENQQHTHQTPETSDPTPNMKTRTDHPSETKHWLMDVIPVLSRKTRIHGLRPHKPVCMKEVTDVEAVKHRQEAVKPVFRFLRRQREMEENKE